MTGLARKAVQVIKKPLNATIIEEVKPPPPPPPPPPPKKIEPPKVQAPLQPYVPPPDIPPPVAPTAAGRSRRADRRRAHRARGDRAAAAAGRGRACAACTAAEACAATRRVVPEVPTSRRIPREAIRAGVEKGRVDAILSIDEKWQRAPTCAIDRLGSAATCSTARCKDALATWKCAADGTKYQASVEINFTLKDAVRASYVRKFRFARRASRGSAKHDTFGRYDRRQA